MWYAALKVLLSAVILVVVSEVARRSSFIGGLIASLPLVSLLAMIWLYVDTGDADKVAALSRSIFWLVIPSLPMFLVLPLLLRRTSLGFPLSLTAACVLTIACYAAMIVVLGRLGVRL